MVLLELVLITGARLGDLLGLEWADVSDEGIGFLNTKNGKVRLVEMTPRMRALFASLPRAPVWVFTGPRTGKPHHNIDKVFARALDQIEHTGCGRGFNGLRACRNVEESWWTARGSNS